MSLEMDLFDHSFLPGRLRADPVLRTTALGRKMANHPEDLVGLSVRLEIHHGVEVVRVGFGHRRADFPSKTKKGAIAGTSAVNNALVGSA